LEDHGIFAHCHYTRELLEESLEGGSCHKVNRVEVGIRTLAALGDYELLNDYIFV
jgi:hypothetical protein